MTNHLNRHECLPYTSHIYECQWQTNVLQPNTVQGQPHSVTAITTKLNAPDHCSTTIHCLVVSWSRETYFLNTSHRKINLCQGSGNKLFTKHYSTDFIIFPHILDIGIILDLEIGEHTKYDNMVVLNYLQIKMWYNNKWKTFTNVNFNL